MNTNIKLPFEIIYLIIFDDAANNDKINTIKTLSKNKLICKHIKNTIDKIVIDTQCGTVIGLNFSSYLYAIDFVDKIIVTSNQNPNLSISVNINVNTNIAHPIFHKICCMYHENINYSYSNEIQLWYCPELTGEIKWGSKFYFYSDSEWGCLGDWKDRFTTQQIYYVIYDLLINKIKFSTEYKKSKNLNLRKSKPINCVLF